MTTTTKPEPVEIPAGVLAELYEIADALPGETIEPSDEVGGYRIIGAVSIGSGRWVENCRLILRREADGALYGCSYARGLTERQPNEYPWDGAKWNATEERYTGGGTVSCYPMMAKTVTTTVYRRA
jgi:hypothetical protein